MGKDPSTVSKWCTNVIQPSIPTLEKIAKLLSVDRRELLNKSNIAENDYNLSASSYVEAKNNREKVDITELNAAISKTVAKTNALRADIDSIVYNLERGNYE